MLTSMMPVPIVCATCNPKNRKATKLKNAAQATAYCGRSTRVETIVAIELAASCSPLRKSNSSATAISAISSGSPSATASMFWFPPDQTWSITTLCSSLATSSKRSTTFSR